MQREINKNLVLDRVWSTVDGTVDADMSATVSFIAGFPTETEDDLCQTMGVIQALLDRRRVNVQLHILAPQRNTPDYDLYGDRLRHDGIYSDISSADARFLEPDWFQRYPALFSSFYYFDGTLPRELVRGLDLFIQGPCTAMQGTVLQMLAGGRSLWNLYRDWRAWADPRGLGGGAAVGQAPDQFLLDFYEYVGAQVEAGRVNLELGHARDEILAFYLRQYGQTPVRFVAPSMPETSPVPALDGGG